MYTMEEEIKRTVEHLGGIYEGTRIFVANNSLAAVKFIVSMNSFSFRVFGCEIFSYYGMATVFDRQSQSKYLDLLTDYKEIDENSSCSIFASPKKICQVAAEFKCKYVWPGWGHASEDPVLPAECAKHGLCFLGPSSAAMLLLGSKISANKIAERCKVQTISWKEISNIADAQNFCNRIKYPVMVKTPDGGGGKGIRKVTQESELENAIAVVKKETTSENVFITKFIDKAKHVEIQVVADAYGKVETLSSRDCTLQRRNQKLVEEGPALIQGNIMQSLSEKAKKLISEAKYTGACTVEFIYCNSTKCAYFLEVNPRLQVEHTVTELLGDVNLCAIQWLLATGASIKRMKRMGLLGDFTKQIHVIGARVIAESPNEFSPSTGAVSVSCIYPSGTSGYFALDRGEITTRSDSQFGHVFGTGKTRADAVNALKMALSCTQIQGEVKTLNALIRDLISSESFKKNIHTTAYAEEHRKIWLKKHAIDSFYVIVFAAVYMHDQKLNKVSTMFETDGVEIEIEGWKIDEQLSTTATYAIKVNNGMSVLEIGQIGSGKYRVRRDNGIVDVFYISRLHSGYEIRYADKFWVFTLGGRKGYVVAPLSGRLVQFLRTEKVKKNEEYIEIESMKNIIRCKSKSEGYLVPLIRPGEEIKVGQIIADLVSAQEIEQSVRYTEKIEYRNTEKEYTYGLFNGYTIPDDLLSYRKEVMLDMMHKYADTTINYPLADLYIENVLQRVLAMDKNEQKCYIDAVKRIRDILAWKTTASSTNAVQLAQKLLSLTDCTYFEIEEGKIIIDYIEDSLYLKGITRKTNIYSWKRILEHAETEAHIFYRLNKPKGHLYITVKVEEIVTADRVKLKKDLIQVIYQHNLQIDKSFTRSITIEGKTKEESFYMHISVDKGYKEGILHMGKEDSPVYMIEEVEIHNKETRKEALKQINVYGSKEEILLRRKAILLNTIYVYDMATLIKILLRERYKDITLSEIDKENGRGMKGWIVKSAGKILFVLVSNDITQNNGCFSINEDIFFAKCGNIALYEQVPFVYVSSNSGAKVEVVEALKGAIMYNESKDIIYMEEEKYNVFEGKNEIDVEKIVMDGKNVYRIVCIFGKYGVGVENLSYSAEIAKIMARINRTIPCITYVTGRAVGIGAYLARIGGRVIQKINAPIILTGFQALNKLLQRNIYKSNLEIGGPEIHARNGTVHLTALSDPAGIIGILTWLDFVFCTRPTTDAIKNIHTFTIAKSNNQSQNQLEEMFLAEEIAVHISDRGSYVEYMKEWVPNVSVGRAKINGLACGIIFPSSVQHMQRKCPWITKEVLLSEYILLPDTAKKIAQAIREFTQEKMCILIFVHWKGFTAQVEDMQNGILEHGSAIVSALEIAEVPVFVYLCPNAELRGGSWVVFDKKIGRNIFFAAHERSKGSVLHPDGLIPLKFKSPDAESILKRSGIFSCAESKMKLGRKFCSLHDTAHRMKKMNVIDQIVSVSELKKSVYTHFISNLPSS